MQVCHIHHAFRRPGRCKVSITIANEDRQGLLKMGKHSGLHARAKNKSMAIHTAGPNAPCTNAWWACRYSARGNHTTILGAQAFSVRPQIPPHHLPTTRSKDSYRGWSPRTLPLFIGQTQMVRNAYYGSSRTSPTRRGYPTGWDDSTARRIKANLPYRSIVSTFE